MDKVAYSALRKY